MSETCLCELFCIYYIMYLFIIMYADHVKLLIHVSPFHLEIIFVNSHFFLFPHRLFLVEGFLLLMMLSCLSTLLVQGSFHQISIRSYAIILRFSTTSSHTALRWLKQNINKSFFNSPKTPHTSSSRVSYGVSFVSILRKNWPHYNGSTQWHSIEPGSCTFSGLILGVRRANERRRYKVTPSLIGWAQT